MNKKREIAYSRALVPKKGELYKKISISVLIIGVIALILYFGK